MESFQLSERNTFVEQTAKESPFARFAKKQARLTADD